ncbi:hypothetical protein P692DRAFT_20842110 [Suillus brevipes Sb2]|nr:hypothetical protein P692DRAFT_20842110 [Suillus brevipes Sb2]
MHSRATPHGEKPESVEEYERRTGKVAKERQMNRGRVCLGHADTMTETRMSVCASSGCRV